MTASDILKLLKKKHHEDVFIPECKNGPTQYTSGMLKFDVWVMKKSWANPLAIGYEIKINRRDFLNDDKWIKYLDYCNEFYFVSPYNLIFPNELPSDVGLYYVSKTGTKLYRKKKAAYRKIEIPGEIFRYILMNRVVITSANYYRVASLKEYWGNWLSDKEIDYRFGQYVSKKIREKVEKEILSVRKENDRLRLQNEKLEDMKETIKRLGLEVSQIDNLYFKQKVLKRLEEVGTGIPDGLINYLDQVIYNLGKVRNIFT